MSEYADNFRASISNSMAATDQLLAHLRDDDELLDHIGEIVSHAFTLGRELRMVGATHVEVLSLVNGSVLSAIEQAFDIQVPDYD